MENPKTTYKWPIDDFSNVARRSYLNELTSPVFSLHSLKFYLRFDPTNRNSDSSNNHSSLYFYAYDLDNEESVNLNLKVWLENNSGHQLAKQELQRSFNKQSNNWECAQFVHHDEVYDNKNDFIKNDFLFVCCEVEYLVPKPEILFKWPIKNVSNVVNLDSQLESKQFRIPSIKSTFNLLFHPVNKNDVFKNYSSLCLRVNDLKTAATIYCKFWIENNRGERMEQTAEMFLFGAPTDYVCFPEFVRQDKLHLNNNNFIKDDFVFMCCELKVLLSEKEQCETDLFKDKGSFKKKTVMTSYYIVPIEDNMFTVFILIKCTL
ncbi:hypothetical protein M3Y97_00668800 [Aphelenchoides bicaudatus]|nr:hypothetical protein M3Y97_00668800 [Aphelenchoides bicaudatus]